MNVKMLLVVTFSNEINISKKIQKELEKKIGGKSEKKLLFVQAIIAKTLCI